MGELYLKHLNDLDAQSILEHFLLGASNDSAYCTKFDLDVHADAFRIHMYHT